MASVSRHRAGVRATVPAVQVRGECSYGTCRSSQQARLGLLPGQSEQQQRSGPQEGGLEGRSRTRRDFLLSAKREEEESEEEEEEEGLFKADAVNEEDPERDRATQV